MNGTEGRILSEERRRKSDEAQQFSEDRAQLLDTIREMIDIEFDRRGVRTDGSPHPENPPLEEKGRESPEAKTEKPPDSKPPRRTLRQRIVSFFTACPSYNK